MVGWKSKRMVFRACLCALPVGFAISSLAQSPGPAPLGIASQSVIEPGRALGREPKSTTSGNPLWLIPLTALSTTRERPIFSPSRRPPSPQIAAAPYVPRPPPPPPAPPAEPDHPLLTLLGTLAGNSQGVGIFIDQNDNAPVSLKSARLIGDGSCARCVDGKRSSKKAIEQRRWLCPCANKQGRWRLRRTECQCRRRSRTVIFGTGKCCQLSVRREVRGPGATSNSRAPTLQQLGAPAASDNAD